MSEKTREIAERHKIRQSRKKRRLAFFLSVMFVLIVALSLFLAIMLTPVCNVRKISVSGNERVLENDIVSTLALQTTTKVYQLDKKLIQKRLETLPYVKSAQVKTHIWGSVDIKITEAKIGGYILYNSNAVLFDETGKVVDITGEIPNDVIKIEGCSVSSASAGEKISIDTSEKFDIILMYVSEFEKAGILKKMSMLDVSDTVNVKGIYENRYDVFFGDFSGLEHKIAMMKQAISHNAENEMGTIDLRISNNAYVKPERSFVSSEVIKDSAKDENGEEKEPQETDDNKKDQSGADEKTDNVKNTPPEKTPEKTLEETPLKHLLKHLMQRRSFIFARGAKQHKT